MSKILISFVVIVLLNTTVSAESKLVHFVGKGIISSAIVPVQHAFAITGQSVNISCNSGSSPLKSCRWERVPSLSGQICTVCANGTTKTEINPFDESKGDYNCSCVHSYIGKGLDKGDCSISLKNVSDFHLAYWECTLVGMDNRVWNGVVNVARFSSQPYIKVAEDNGVCLSESRPTSVMCCIDHLNDPILSVKIKMELENRNKENTTVFSNQFGISSNFSLRGKQACLRVHHKFRPEDNHKNIVCTTSFIYDKHEHQQKTVFPVNFTFTPLLLRNFSQQISDPNVLRISVPFLANPIVNVSWYLKTDPTTGASFIIRKNHVKYKTFILHHQGNNYSAILEIVNFTEDDYRKQFLVCLTNTCGRKELVIALNNPSHSNEFQADNYWITILIAISAITFAVLLASVLFTVIRHRVKVRGKYVPTQVAYSTDGDNVQMNH